MGTSYSYYVALAYFFSQLSNADSKVLIDVELPPIFAVTQGLQSEFQITGANHHFMTLIQLKTFQLLLVLKVYRKLTGAIDF